MQEKIFELVKENFKNPKMYAVMLTMIVGFILIFPYLDANLFYYKRINDRVETLTKVAAIDTDSIKNNDTLSKEYKSILEEINNQPESLVINILTKDNNPKVLLGKFISGGFLSWVLAIICLFYKSFEKKIYKLFAFFLLSIIGIIIGLIARSIPNIFNPWVNYIGLPIVLLIIIALLVTNSNSKKANNSENNNK